MSPAATLVLPDWVDEIDLAVDEWWERLRGNPVLDRIYYVASTAGDFSLIWHAYNAGRLSASRSSKGQAVRLTAALAVESLVVNQILKRLFRRERPIEERVRPHRLRQPSTTSFPSGHASSATMAAILLSEESGLAPLNAALAAIVATSRIHVRIHHASDVVAGAIVGAVLAQVWRRVWPVTRV